jgi:cysteine-rich repeat protein
VPSDGTAEDRFGKSVAISGDRLVVGTTDGTGSAYVFDRQGDGTWQEGEKLVANDGDSGDMFGDSVAIDGDHILVGALRDDVGASDSGSAYVFERQPDGSWDQVQKLVASDGGASERFGKSVSISGDRLVVGSNSGAPYIFERQPDGTWDEVQKLVVTDSITGQQFGFSVAIHEDRVVVGAVGDDDNGTESGSVYVFERETSGTWSQAQKVIASSGAAQDHFGWHVAIHGDRFVVGVRDDDTQGSNSGAVYVFERQTSGVWTETDKILASDGLAHDYFGFHVAIDGGRVLVGATSAAAGSIESGVAYLFAYTPVCSSSDSCDCKSGYLGTDCTETLCGDGVVAGTEACDDGDTDADDGCSATCHYEVPDGYVYIPAGTFTMGSPESEPCRDADETQHAVVLTRPFAMKKTEVTQAQWSAVMGTNPSYFTGCEDCPVERVSWWDAVAYCNELSEDEGLTPCYTLNGCTGTVGEGCAQSSYQCTDGYSCTSVSFAGLDCDGYRLPTEAEWEYAARAGTSAATHNGDIAADNCDGASTVLDPIAWYNQSSSSMTHLVGEKSANAWELSDTLGNVWEWTWDGYADYPAGEATDPTGPQSAPSRVYRGGSWYDAARYGRAARRNSIYPAWSYHDVGFRPVRTLALDNDNDGVSSLTDCDDTDPDIYPEAGDIYGDGVDSDCDGLDCEATMVGTVYYAVCTATTDGTSLDTDWQDAHDTCQAYGYDGLAKVASAAENAALLTLVEDAGSWPDIWIGLSDPEDDGIFTWMDDTVADYNDWCCGEPSSAEPNCVELYSANDYHWNDRNCGENFPFVCEVGSRCGNGTIDPGETCDDGNTDDDDGCSAVCLSEPNTTSCAAILNADPNAPDGLYSIDPDGSGALSPVDLFCDMSGGGWTLVGNYYDSMADDFPNDTSYVVSGWQQTAFGGWDNSATTVDRSCCEATGSAAVSLAFVEALGNQAIQSNLKMCFVHQAGHDTTCRESPATLTLVNAQESAYFAPNSEVPSDAPDIPGNSKLQPYASDRLTFTFGRLGGLAGSTDGYDYSTYDHIGYCVPRTPGVEQGFGTNPYDLDGLCEYADVGLTCNAEGVWHAFGQGMCYRPSYMDNSELAAPSCSSNGIDPADPNVLTYGFRLYVGP